MSETKRDLKRTKMKLTNDIVLASEICAALRKNRELFGAGYCPCIPNTKYHDSNAADYICPCKDFKENIKIGETCRCGLFIKE